MNRHTRHLPIIYIDITAASSNSRYNAPLVRSIAITHIAPPVHPKKSNIPDGSRVLMPFYTANLHLGLVDYLPSDKTLNFPTGPTKSASIHCQLNCVQHYRRPRLIAPATYKRKRRGHGEYTYSTHC